MPIRPALHAFLLKTIAGASLACCQAAFANGLPAGCTLHEHASLPLTYADDLRPVAKATIGSATVPVMLSTGSAESLVFNKKTLDRIGMTVHAATSTLLADDQRNPTGSDLVRDVSYASVMDFSFGAADGEKGFYRVEEFMDDRFGLRIGAGSLLRTDLEIALDGGYLKLFKPEGCLRAHLAYWDAQAVPVPAMADPWQRDLRMVFNVSINGKNMAALLSTATPHSYLPKAAAERIGLTSGSPGATREAPLPGHQDDRPVWKIPLPALSIGALEVKDLDLRLMDLPYEGVVLVLGADFLHRHRVYIARDQGRIYFSPVANPRTLKRGSVDVIPHTPI